MIKFKGLIFLLCLNVVLSCYGLYASAEETSNAASAPETTAAPLAPKSENIPTAAPISAPTASTVIIDFTMNPTDALPSTAYFELYDTNGTLLDYTSQTINNTITSFTLTFRVPEYTLGKTFRLKLAYGMKSITYYDNTIYIGETLDFSTYYYADENSNAVIGNHFLMTAGADLEKRVNMYIDGVYKPVKSRVINGTLMVPVLKTAPLLGIDDVKLDYTYNSVRVAVGTKDILFNIGSTYTTLFGGDWYTPVPTTWLDDDAYVPLRLLAEAFDCPLSVYDHYDYMDVMLSGSRDVQKYISLSNLSKKEQYVRDAGLTSQTNYLIWISKANFEVNVFERKNGLWKLMESIPCTIGTDATPTCVGTYRYYEKIPRWTYPDFYVGPVMRFNGGYAIHSTLLKYDGTNYNAAVRKKLSHGCVRIRPDKMNWLISLIPMYTTVHVTNE